MAVAAGLTIALIGGCSATRTPFARAAGDAGSTLSAAYETLTMARQGSLTREYAQGSLANLAEQLDGVGDELAQLPGAPDVAIVRRLEALLDASLPVVEMPCLEGACAVGQQLSALAAARDAFVEAAGS